MAEIDLAAKRHVMTTAGQTGAGGTGGYALGDNGDATDHAEKQVGENVNRRRVQSVVMLTKVRPLRWLRAAQFRLSHFRARAK